MRSATAPARALAALAALAACAVLAAAPTVAAPSEGDLRVRLAVDVPVTAVAVGALLGSEAAKPSLAPERCRVCGTNGFDDWFRTRLLWSEPSRAARISDLLAYGALPLAAAAHAAVAAGSARRMGEDLLVTAEVVALALDLAQLAKFTVGRERPYAAARDPVEKELLRDDDQDLSFFSGHTTLAFSIAAVSGTVASLRGYRSAPWVYAVGFATATTVGYLRIAADKHHMTDVLAGAAVGTAMGLLLPRVLHRAPSEETAGGTSRLLPAPGGIAFVF